MAAKSCFMFLFFFALSVANAARVQHDHELGEHLQLLEHVQDELELLGQAAQSPHCSPQKPFWWPRLGPQGCRETCSPLFKVGFFCFARCSDAVGLKKLNSTDCVFTCPPGTYTSADGSECLTACPSGQKIFNGTACVEQCPAGLVHSVDGAQCLSACPAGQKVVGGNLCVEKCPDTHVPSKDGALCLCPAGKKQLLGTTTCYDQCPAFARYVSIDRSQCLARCPQPQLELGNSCVDKCPRNLYVSYNFSACVTSCPRLTVANYPQGSHCVYPNFPN